MNAAGFETSAARFQYFTFIALLVGPLIGYVALVFGLLAFYGKGGGLFLLEDGALVFAYILGEPNVIAVLVISYFVLHKWQTFRLFETALVAFLVGPLALGLFILAKEGAPSGILNYLGGASFFFLFLGYPSAVATIISWGLADLLAKSRTRTGRNEYAWWPQENGKPDSDRFGRPSALPPDKSGEIDNP